jgi:hypothetical protein
MLCLALAASLLLIQPPAQGSQTLYQRVITRPDFNNGYEDYIRAADMIGHNPRLDAYLYWTPKSYSQELARKQAGYDIKSESGWSERDEMRLNILRELKDMDYLSVQRLTTDVFRPALERIRVGNQKRVWDPREKIETTTVFPELSAFKTLAKLFSADAYEKFADGDSKGATSDLLDGLTFARRMGGGSMIADLVSIASYAIIFAVFEDNLSRLTERDASRIIDYVESALSESPTIRVAMQREKALMLASVDLLLQAAGELNYLWNGDAQANGLAEYIMSMSLGERKAVKTHVTKTLTDFYDRIDSQFAGPEENWSTPIEQSLPTEPKVVANAQDCSDAIVNVVTPVFSQATQALMKSRAQLRLLGLHTRIIAFKWQNMRLPASLAEVASTKQSYDPIGKSSFQYELLDGSYKLYSSGFATTGPIELRYRRPANLPTSNDPIPPGATSLLGGSR